MNKTADRIKTEVSPAYILTILKKVKNRKHSCVDFHLEKLFYSLTFVHYFFLFLF